MSHRHFPMQSWLFLVLSFLFMIGFTACGNEQTGQVSMASMAPLTTKDTKEKDRQFMTRAVEMNYEQIMIAKLAWRRATSEAIRTLAKDLEDANRAERSMIASLGVMKSIAVASIPTPSAQAAYDSLNLATIEEFDHLYIQRVMEGYQEAIRHFEQGTTAEVDPDIKAKAKEILPLLRAHYSRVSMFSGQMNPVSEVTE